MPTPPPGAQLSEDGYYWWNDNTGDPNEPARWELVEDQGTTPATSAASAASTGATEGAAAAAQSSDPSQDPSQQQSDAGDVTLEWEYTTDEEMSLALDDLVASGWEPGSEDEMA